jgi:DNA-directed RNA polymerase subunit RPC12/RpoP
MTQSTTSFKCPKCGGTNLKPLTSVFVEWGEWNGSYYAAEGDVDVYRCQDCGMQFADFENWDFTNPNGEKENEE